MNTNGRPIELRKLIQEAAAAGLSIPRSLFLSGNEVTTIDAEGHHIEPPAGLAAVIAAHVPTPMPDPVDVGSDAANLDTQAAAAVQQLRQFNATDFTGMTPAQALAQIVPNAKLQNRILIEIIRRMTMRIG